MPQLTPEEAAAIAAIESILADVAELHAAVEQFPGGGKSGKDYCYLDEKLLQQLLRLDEVDTGGSEDIRQRRKDAVQRIQGITHQLEAKATDA